MLLIGRVEVIYDAFSEPKLYPASHVSYPTYGRNGRSDAGGKTPGGSHCTPARSRNLDRDYFYHSSVRTTDRPGRSLRTYARSSMPRVIMIAFMHREKQRSARDGACTRACTRAFSRSTGTNNNYPAGIYRPVNTRYIPGRRRRNARPRSHGNF